MPIGGKPLLLYWLDALYGSDVNKVLVNLHYFADEVTSFINSIRPNNWITTSYERVLLGTAGTIRANKVFFSNDSLLVIHGDNWSMCDLIAFIKWHIHFRPKSCPISMMTFMPEELKDCGVVSINQEGIVQNFYEKVEFPPSKIANAAIYIFEPEIIDWISNNPNVTDISTQVIPNYIGRIATWHNAFSHRDIGTVASILECQKEEREISKIQINIEWIEKFKKNLIHSRLNMLAELKNE